MNFALHSAHAQANDSSHVSKLDCQARQWVHLAASYDGSGKVEGLQLFVNGAPADTNRSGTVVEGSTRAEGSMVLGQRPNKVNHFTDGSIQDLRVYGRRLSLAEFHTLAVLPDLRADAATAADKRKKDRLTTYYLEHRDSIYQGAMQQLQQLEDEQRQLQARSVITHVQEEKMNSPAMANILTRGQYDKVGEKVTPAVFTALNPLPANAPPNRLGLAQWLVDPQNPLTARVTVNRYWQEVFGTGIVKTSEDFGIMGDAPSHPELLDWLAVEFRESGWNVQHIFRLMLTSATYRQSATATPDKITKDRENRLLSRGPRFRMDAEMISRLRPRRQRHALAEDGGPGDKTVSARRDLGSCWCSRRQYARLQARYRRQPLSPQSLHVLEADGPAPEYGNV